MLNSNTKSIPELCSRGLSIACLNINSLIEHIDQLRIFIHSLRSNIDVLAINETKLDSSITNNEISTPGYDVAC
jgi:exonuclease III